MANPPSGAPPAGAGVTRRQALKRGVAFGAAVVWATPTLQVVRMSRALAAETSPANCVTYCIKYDVADEEWSALGNGIQACLDCPEPALNSLPPFIDQFSVEGDPESLLTVRYPAPCTLADGDPSPDPFADGTAAAKCGTGSVDERCSFRAPDDETIEDGFHVLTFTPCENGAGISHIELIIRCCDTEASA